MAPFPAPSPPNLPLNLPLLCCLPQVSDESEMAALEAKAAAGGIPTYIVHDAGRTQIAAGSQTVLAIGPAPKSQLDTVTGHLKLL